MRARKPICDIPVYSLRDQSSHPTIAAQLARGLSAAFYVGLYGVVQRVRPAWSGLYEADKYWQIKPGRPTQAKIPLFIKPSDALRLVDFDQVHPAFRHLAKRERFERLWNTHPGPLHVIAPVRKTNFLHPCFVTTPTDYENEPMDRYLPEPTVCLFWTDDPSWHSLYDLTRLYSPPRSFFGPTSFNEHGKHPPYTFRQLVFELSQRGSVPFDLIINDEWFEQSGAFSSHTQVRLPLKHEKPELHLIRTGAVSGEMLTTSTGYQVRAVSSVTVASRPDGLTDEELALGLRKLDARRNGARN